MKLKTVLFGLTILFSSLIGCQQTEKITTKIDTVKMITTKYDTVVINKKDTVVIVNNDTIYISDNPENGTDHNTPRINGAFKAIITGTLRNGTTFSDSIDYSYTYGYDFIGLNDGDSSIIINRYESNYSFDGAGEYDNNANSYIKIWCDVQNFDKPNQVINPNTVQLNFSRVLNNGQLLHITLDNGGIASSTTTITSLVYNTSTNLLSFDFALNDNGTFNSTRNPLTITGKFSGIVYMTED